MSEDNDTFRAIKQERQMRGMNRRALARDDFSEAEHIADEADLCLRECSNTHYQLIGDGWIINLYPGNQRIYADKGGARAPYLEVAHPWTLITAVQAAIKATT